MWSEAERQIFGPYHDGRAQVYGDPLAIWRRLVHGLDGDVNRWLTHARSEEPEIRYQATERILVATVEAFDLAPFDRATGQGVLERDAMAILNTFFDWIDQKKSPPVNSPTSAPPTTSVPGPSRMAIMPDCGCS